MSIACGIPILKCVYCLVCARCWVWKHCLRNVGHDNETSLSSVDPILAGNNPYKDPPDQESVSFQDKIFGLRVFCGELLLLFSRCLCCGGYSNIMGRKAGGLYINPKKFGAIGKPCMKEMVTFLGCLSLNKNNDDKCVKQKDLLLSCVDLQKGKPKNPARTINYHLQRLGKDKHF